MGILAHPPKKIWVCGIILSNMIQIKVVPNCLKCRENWSKIVFEFLEPPPPKKNMGGKFWSEIKINKSCSKLPEMARKLVFNFFFSLKIVGMCDS